MPLFGSLGTEFHVTIKRSDGSSKKVIMSEKEYKAYKREKAAEKERMQDVDPVRDTASRRRTSTVERDVREPARGARTSEIRDDYDNRPAPRADKSSRHKSSHTTHTKSRSSHGPSSFNKKHETSSKVRPELSRSQEVSARESSKRNTVHVSTTPMPSGGSRTFYALPKDTEIRYSDYNDRKVSYSKTPAELYTPSLSTLASRPTETSSKPRVIYVTPAEARGSKETHGKRTVSQGGSSHVSRPAVDTSNDEYLARMMQDEMNLSAEPQEIEGYDPERYGPDVPKLSSRAAEKAPARQNQSMYDEMLARQLQDEANGVKDAVVEVTEDDYFPVYNASQYERDPNGASSSKTRTYSYKVAGGNDFPDYDATAFEAAASRNARLANNKQAQRIIEATKRTKENIALVNNFKGDSEAELARQTTYKNAQNAYKNRYKESSDPTIKRNNDWQKFESAMGEASKHYFNMYQQVIGDLKYPKVCDYDRNYPTSSAQKVRDYLIPLIVEEAPKLMDQKDHVQAILDGLERTLTDKNTFDQEVSLFTFPPKDASREVRESWPSPMKYRPPEMLVDILSFTDTTNGAKRSNLLDGVFKSLREIGEKDYERYSDGSKYKLDCARGQVEGFIQPLEGYMAYNNVTDEQLINELSGRFGDYVKANKSRIEKAISSGDSIAVSNTFRDRFMNEVLTNIVNAEGSIVPMSQLRRVMDSGKVWPKDFDLDLMI